MTLTDLKRENERLQKLLIDPHPGLITWCLAVRDTVKIMSQIVGTNNSNG